MFRWMAILGTIGLSFVGGSAPARAAENRAPICAGDGSPLAARWSGIGAVRFTLDVTCSDPDGDAFTVTGTGAADDGRSISVSAGQEQVGWWFDAATTQGSGRAGVAATDVHGARSADYSVAATWGPHVHLPPECRLRTSAGGEEETRVLTRPGRPRRLGFICQDVDADPFAVSFTATPARGSLRDLVIGPWHRFDDSFIAPEHERISSIIDITGTYLPADPGLEEDSFTLQPSGGRPLRVVVEPRSAAQNDFTSCGWAGLQIPQGGRGDFRMRCEDPEGDALTATIVHPPAHGTAKPPILSVDAAGTTIIRVPYVPDPGFAGADGVTVAVSDGHGFGSPGHEFGSRLTPDVFVDAPPDPTRIVSALWPRSVSSAPLQARSAHGAPPVDAKRVLRTGAVRHTRVLRGVDVWTPRQLSRRRLKRAGRVPAVLVRCTSGCRLRSRAGASRFTGAVGAGRARVLYATTVRTRSRRVRLRVEIRRSGHRRVVRRVLRLR